jgi:hypothetical protein
MSTVRSLIVLGAFAFVATPSAHADFMYTFNDTTPPMIPPQPPLTGSFSVKDSAVSSGNVFFSDVTAFSFSIVVQNNLLTFNTLSLLDNPPIKVDVATGDLLPSGGSSPPTLFSQTSFGDNLFIRFNGASNNDVTFEVDTSEGPTVTGQGTFTHPSLQPVPEPASLVLMASGAALCALYGGHRHLRRSPRRPHPCGGA